MIPTTMNNSAKKLIPQQSEPESKDLYSLDSDDYSRSLTAYVPNPLQKDIVDFGLLENLIDSKLSNIEDSIKEIIFLVKARTTMANAHTLTHKDIDFTSERKFKELDEIYSMVNSDELKIFFDEHINVLDNMKNIQSIIYKYSPPREISLEYYFDLEEGWEKIFVNIFFESNDRKFLENAQDKLSSNLHKFLPFNISDKIIPSVQIVY